MLKEADGWRTDRPGMTCEGLQDTASKPVRPCLTASGSIRLHYLEAFDFEVLERALAWS